MFANDNLSNEDHETNFNEEDDLSSDNNVDSEHKHLSSSNSDTNSEYESDDEFC
jgi:hypothetical protein